MSQRHICDRCMNRRAFLAGAAGVAGALTVGDRFVWAEQAARDTGKTRIRLVFSHHRQDDKGKQSEPGWPYLGYDSAGKTKEVLDRLIKACPGCEFLPATAYTADDAKKILESDKDIDGHVAYMLGGWAGTAQTIAAAGKPVIFVGDLYGASGEILVDIAWARRNKMKAVGVTSSRFEDVVDAIRCFETLKKLRSSTIVVIGGNPGDIGKAIEETFRTKVVPIEFKEINDLWEKADRQQARKQARKWMTEAAKVVEPTAEEIEKSAAMYLALQQLLARHNAQAVTMNCLGGVYGGHTRAYPCLGFFQLNDDGRVGACEADVQSTITMLIMKYLVGKPGFISDPVVDTATNRVVYIHCVAPTKVHGPAGAANAYEIRSHAEDRKGASINSLMPLGQVVTTLQVAPTRKEVLIHQAKTVENIDDHRSCRTKLAAEIIGDVDKLLSEWDRWGWHRVTFYGDHKRAVEQIATLAGFALIREA